MYNCPFPNHFIILLSLTSLSDLLEDKKAQKVGKNIENMKMKDGFTDVKTWKHVS